MSIWTLFIRDFTAFMFSYFLPHSSLSWGRHIIAFVQSVFRVHLSLSPGVLVMAEPRSKLWVYFFSFKSLFSLKLLMVLSCESSHSSDIQFSLLFSQILSSHGFSKWLAWNSLQHKIHGRWISSQWLASLGANLPREKVGSYEAFFWLSLGNQTVLLLLNFVVYCL